MKELDLYSNREAYSFPFCPKVYKYVILNNGQVGKELIFDIYLLLERVPQKISSLELTKDAKSIRLLASKVSDIVAGFDYLHRRFGAFSITEEMIGLTELGIVKVWLNEDFSLNTKS